MRIDQWIIFFVLFSSVSAKEVTVVEIKDFRKRDFASQGILLKGEVDLQIETIGAGTEQKDRMLAYGWILDSSSREVVWKMIMQNSKEHRPDPCRKAVDTIRLPQGEYEIYFAVSPLKYWESGYENVGDFLDDLFDGFPGRKWRQSSRSWGITLSVDHQDMERVVLNDIDESDSAVIRLTSLGDDEFKREGFSLTRETSFRIYAIGEGEDGEMFDYGWIIDYTTGEVIWEMDYSSTDHAGGGMKNRVMDQEIVLSPGKYVVTFVTDESHSYGNWNRLPPFDPAHWGITLWGLDEDFDKDLAVISLIPENGANKIVDITRVGNDRFETYGFTLKKKTTIRVHCLGEYGYKDRFVDYGWLLDAETREHVWKMDVKDSRHAGGARKNRIAINTLTLDPGSYEACYITDDSHAYQKWNSGPPYNPEAWGITIFVVDDDFDPETVRSYDEQDDPSMLVQVIRMEDNERLRRRFQLEESAQIRVYAVGEGDDNKMYDYGWIEDDNGRCVWEMEYQDTEHAGGARKNRMVNHVIVLSQGQYTVYFRTDGSHSFEEWNDDPPADPVHWGITVRREQRTEMD